MSENHFTFLLIQQRRKKHSDISDDVSEWLVRLRCGDCLISTPDWDRTWAVWSQQRTNPKSEMTS